MILCDIVLTAADTPARHHVLHFRELPQRCDLALSTGQESGGVGLTEPFGTIIHY